MTPPIVSRPRERGLTSLSIRSRNSPVRMPACTAAPIATTSSGLTDWQGSRGTRVRTMACTIGMRVPPPTNTTSSISSAARPESRRARCTGRSSRSSRSPQRPSKVRRSRVVSMWSGPASAVAIKGREMGVLCTPESSCLAFSAASVSRCRAWRSRRRSMWCWAKKASASQSTMRRSQSLPPSWVSPLVALTSKTPLAIRNTDTSKVPPPRSNTSTRLTALRSKP